MNENEPAARASRAPPGRTVRVSDFKRGERPRPERLYGTWELIALQIYAGQTRKELIALGFLNQKRREFIQTDLDRMEELGLIFSRGLDYFLTPRGLEQLWEGGKCQNQSK